MRDWRRPDCALSGSADQSQLSPKFLRRTEGLGAEEVALLSPSRTRCRCQPWRAETLLGQMKPGEASRRPARIGTIWFFSAGFLWRGPRRPGEFSVVFRLPDQAQCRDKGIVFT